MVAKSLNLLDLDALAWKADLIEFMKLSPLFKDYDFTGSNLNLQAEMLGYNGNKHAFLTNMLLSEAFLDSAQLEGSVFSHAKDLNYLPRSARSAVANVTVNFTATSVSQPYVIPKGASFSTLIKNNAYVFSIPESIVVSSPNTQFTFTTNIYEGVYVKDSYVFQTTELIPYPRFRITNKNIDTTSLTVVVYEDNSSVGTVFRQATSLLGLDQLDRIYFLQTSETGYYELQFGDNVVGYTPKQNSMIVLDYRITNADLANGAKNFSINFDPTGINELTSVTDPITVNQVAVGGAQPEALESVRYYAPRHFQTQERCVVPTDYEVLMKVNFPEINAVTAYGGEQLTPPRFGYVVVSVDLPGLDTLPISKETEYNNFLLRRMGLSLKPLFIDPERIYVQVNSVVRYNINITTNTPSYIQSVVATAIANYNIDHLNDFNVTLRYSPLCDDIDEADPSIISNITTLQLYKKLIPSTGIFYDYMVEFGVPINPGISSTGVMYKGEHTYLQDDKNGVMQIFQYVHGNPVIITNVGTVDYESGIVRMPKLMLDAYDGEHLKIYASPVDNDITTRLHSIMAIEADEVHVNIEKLSE